jgi:uncharacterized protein YndB with AHSA1/START domain
MTLVSCTIEIAAPRKRVWEVVMSPERLADWVTIHRSLGPAPSQLRRGSRFEQTLNLRGAHVHVDWTVIDVDPPSRAVWEGHGPARSRASIVYELQAVDEQATRFVYTNEFKAPGGPLGAVAGRVLVGGLSQREAQRSLQRLKQLVENE